MSNTIGYYVLDLSALLKQEALDAKARAVAATGLRITSLSWDACSDTTKCCP